MIFKHSTSRKVCALQHSSSKKTGGQFGAKLPGQFAPKWTGQFVAKWTGQYLRNLQQVSNPKFNEYIKEVSKLAGISERVKITHKRGNKTIEEVRPKYAWITSHTCRRSFCTNEYLAGTPTDLIMTISGHKTEKAFRKYIKADKVQKANMIKKLWDSRPGL